MLKNTIKKIFKRFGYQAIKIKPSIKKKSGYQLFEYQDSKGQFDYNKYKQIQTEGNKRKINNVWVIEENVAFLAQYIKDKKNGHPEFGLCHGTRRGKEQKWFRKYLNCEVIGTEISDSANQFSNTIQWDFHETKEEWKNSVDFIYSNSFDHSYNPKKCLDAWMSCLNEDGICIIEHTSQHEKPTQLDPFGAQLMMMPYLVLNWGGGKYFVCALLQAPSKSNSHYIYYLIIKNC